MNIDLYKLILEELLDEAEINEFSGVGSIGGVATPLGAGPSGKVKYRSGSSKSDSAYKKRSKKTKSPSWYLKNGPAKRKKLQEQNQTQCLTSGAIFNTRIEPKDVGINVSLPFDLEIDEIEAERLETLLHNAVEMILRPYFMKDTVINNEPVKKEKSRKVIAFDFHGTLVDEEDDGTVIPRYEMIEKLKQYYKDYNFIVIYTAAPEEDRELISGQLHSLGIPYDVLAMEKPRFDKMYDDRYVGPESDWV